ncbi:hypothetical protein LJC20_00360 [Eubacteriales bacterium OttesenSCG-928-M02]|nr:hypothetical protein [Eubacteriales bacterium OttesenSCG-928-M02]
MSIDYSKLSGIVVRTQEEFDLIPDDFTGRIYVESDEWIVVNRKFCYRVEAWGNSSVVAWGNSSVEAWGNSSVEARENSSVEARGNSSVEARENSSVEARGNVQIAQLSERARLQISGNARIVYLPKTIHEFMDFYGVEHTKTRAVFYKAVHKKGDMYQSDYDKSFFYEIGKKVSEECNESAELDCSNGIHISHLAWAIDFGRGWDDLAILEVRTKINNIVLPKGSDGKVRTSEVEVLREVPLEECGLYGKILAKRRKNDG